MFYSRGSQENPYSVDSSTERSGEVSITYWTSDISGRMCHLSKRAEGTDIRDFRTHSMLGMSENEPQSAENDPEIVFRGSDLGWKVPVLGNSVRKIGFLFRWK